MEGISDIRIAGIDEKRRPRIRKEPYINLYFSLSHKAPPDWCADFNRLVSKHQYSTKIQEDEGLYIETWVRTPDEIPAHLTELKGFVASCTTEYIAKASVTAANANDLPESGPQGRLNEIVAALNFD